MKKKIYLLLLFVSIYFIQPVFAQRDGWYLYDNPGIVNDMVQDSIGNFHLATSSGYVKLSHDLEVLEHFTLFNNSDLATNEFKSVTIHPVTGKVVICSDKNEILEKDGDSFTAIPYNPTNPFAELTRIWITETNDIIVKGSWLDTGLHLYSQGNWSELNVNNVNDFVEGPDGLWYFGTSQDAIQTYNKTSQVWSVLPNSPISTTEWVSDLLLDESSNSLFIATSSNGIFEYNLNDSSSTNYKDFSLSGISQIFKEDDTLHVSHQGQGYSKCVMPSNTWTNYNPSNSSLNNNWLYNAFPIDGGVLLRPSGAVFEFSPIQDTVTNLILNRDGVDFNNFRKIQVRKVGDNMQFFGTTYQNGLVFKNGDEPFKNFTTQNSILTTTEFTDLDIDADGTIWVSTGDGLYSIDTANNWLRYDTSNSNGLLQSNYILNFATGVNESSVKFFAASVLGQESVVLAKDFPGSGTQTKTIDSTENDHLKNQITAFDISNNILLIGTKIGSVIPVAFSKETNLGVFFGLPLQVRPDSGKIGEVNSLAFDAGIKPEYHFSNFFSVHTEVGFVFALINRPDFIDSDANDDKTPSDTSSLNGATLKFEQTSFGNAGVTFWFKSGGIKKSYLFGFDKDSDEPLQYVDVNNLSDTGTVQITDLNIAPYIYSIIAMPNSDNKLSLYLNTSMGLFVKSDFEIDNTTTDMSALSGADAPIVNAYPNPTSENVNITFNNDFIGNYKVEVRDLNGKLLIEKQNQNSINVEQLASGVYSITVVGQDASNTLMFYKK